MKAYADELNTSGLVSHECVTTGPSSAGEPREPYAGIARTPRQEAHDIIREIAHAAGTGVTLDEVLGKSRLRHIVDVRHASIVAISRRFPWMSYPHLSRLMGGRDHTSIMHALKKLGAYEPRATFGAHGGRGLVARVQGPQIDQLFVHLGAALRASSPQQKEDHHVQGSQ